MVRELIRIMRFGVVGILATVVHACVYAGLVGATQVFPLAANALAFTAAVGIAFLGHTFWTFGRAGNFAGLGALRQPLGRFLTVSLTSFVLNNVVVYAVADIFRLDPLFAVIPMIIVVPVLTYLFLRLWVFAPRVCAQSAENGP
jgi:putative flippase GtrA